MFLTWIADKLIAAPVIGAILGPVINGLLTSQKQKLDAQGTHEAHVEAVAAQALLNDRRAAELDAQMVTAEQGHFLTRLPRPAMGMAITFLVWKLFVYDKALGQWTGGHTDPLSTEMWDLAKVIVYSYFGTRSIEKVADTVTGIFKTK